MATRVSLSTVQLNLHSGNKTIIKTSIKLYCIWYTIFTILSLYNMILNPNKMYIIIEFDYKSF